MAFGDIFKPRHRHSDPSIRARAIEGIGSDEPEILIEIARTDSDYNIRQQAVEKILNPDELDRLGHELAGSLRSTALRRAAEIRAVEVIPCKDAAAAERMLAGINDESVLADIACRAEVMDVRGLALERIHDDRLLARVVRETPTDAHRRAAALRIQDLGLLRSLAVGGGREAALAALERIDDRDMLEEIRSTAQNKAARNKARKNLMRIDNNNTDVGHISDAKLVHAERVQIVATIDKLGRGDEWVHSSDVVAEASAHWDLLPGLPDPDLAERYAIALDRYCANHKRYAPVARKTLAGSSRTLNGEGVQASVARVAVDAGVTTRTPKNGSPSAVPSETQAARPSEASDEAVARLAQLSRRLEALASSEQLRGFERSLRDIEKQRQDIPAKAIAGHREGRARYEQVHAQAKIRLAELRETEEWKRWASLPQLQQLVEEAKALAANADDTENLPRELKRLQARWKEVGTGPREKTELLWNVFKESCDQVYERVKAQRVALNTVQKENLRRKRELCEAAEALASSDDFDATAAALKDLQTQWKRIGPVPRKKADVLWKRFRAVCDEFFAKRRPMVEAAAQDRNDNLQEKEGLLADIEALVSDPMDTEDAIERCRRLQWRWREIGHVPRESYKGLQGRYKKACDAVFARRDRDRKQQEEARQVAVTAAFARVQDARAALGDPSAQPNLPALLQAARADVFALPPRQGQELRVELERLCLEAVSTCPEVFQGSELDPAKSRERRIKLCQKVEALLPDVTDAKEQDMAEKLRAALADRALGGVLSKNAIRDVGAVVAEAREAWARLGPVPNPEGDELQARFARACDEALATIPVGM